MALINNMYIHVTDESVSRDVDTTTHPVEKGIDLTDSVKQKAFEISLSGMIVAYDEVKAQDVLDKLIKLEQDGSLIDYIGRNTANSMQIVSLSTSHPNTTYGGCNFDMTLRQIRVAKSAYVPQPQTPQKQVQEQQKNPPEATLKVGAIVVFKGGPVYVSSDAGTPAAQRGRSTCKITIINTRNWAKHGYHLISQDGKNVYGWVDKSNIEGVPAVGGNAKTNGGTQQVR